MGRKPNALVIKHFERGAKLPDSSNRYQYTCKACGEKFPKGRIDSLIAHLVKKCPVLSIQDRQNALLQLNNLPNIDIPSERCHIKKSSAGIPVVSSNWTALETLAEVSRQFDISEKHENRPANNKKVNQSNGGHFPQILELHEQYTLENPPRSYNQRVHEKKGSNQKKLRNNCDFPHTSSTLDTPEHIPTESPQSLAMTSSNLVEAAAAIRFMPSMVDPQLLGNEVYTQPNVQSDALPESESTTPPTQSVEQAIIEDDQLFTDHSYHHNPLKQKLRVPFVNCTGINKFANSENLECLVGNSKSSASLTYPQIAVNPVEMTTEFSIQYGNHQIAQKPKVRGRFSTSRRKEVQEVRKKGACIRCRMLKKPCSEGTPCNTCKNVESARLWKTPCIRTRVSDELEMYSSGLHAVLAYHEINNLKSRIAFQSSTQHIEASHYPELTIFATFKSLQGVSGPTDDDIDPHLDLSMSKKLLRILDIQNQDIGSKLEAYIKKISSVFYEHEPSKFMHTTLNFAHKIATEKQDHLLFRALNLWSFVHILVDHDISWKLSERVDSDTQAGQGPSIDKNCTSGIYNIICSQLKAAAETKALILCKSVLNEIERRLLQRLATESFETFLVVLITLNCIEKSTWLFKSWQNESFKYRWPLDKSPESICSHGDKLANMLQMLLRMRNVPPKTYTRPEDGILASDVTPVAQEYFKTLNLSYVDVISKQVDQSFDSTNSRCYELRYCSHLLLPIT